ncbi:restriction endonuclease subunit S [Erwinia aphidicola]|uniref:restriction endonuclease subunit S n=1 Tax=Erwinia aphidicola TaxID=68334 RepID=UPI003015F46A
MNENKIPQQWVKTTLGHIVDYGRSAKKTLVDVNDNTWVLELEDIEKDSSKLLSKVKASDRKFKSTKNIFHQGDVLYGKLRPYLNKVIMADEDGVCTTEIIPINAEPFCINRYFFFWLKNPIFLRYVREVSYGVNMPRLGTNDGKSAPFYLAPLAEQKIITDKLDDLLARVESIKTRLENIPDILKKFRTSVLNSAVSYVDENKPSSKKKLSEICRFQNGYAFKSDFFSKDGVHQVIKLANIRDGYLFLENSPSYISPAVFNEFKRYVPDEGDILISMTGTRLKKDYGFACIIMESDNSFLINQRVGRITPLKDIVSPKFLYLFIRSDLFRSEFFKGETGGVNQGNVGSKHIMSIEINLPTLDEQEKIAHQLDNIFSYANALEKKITSSLLKVNNLTQSILAKAFRGELTAQWREENLELISGVNSAEALLQKISTEKLASGVTKKRVKKLAC